MKTTAGILVTVAMSAVAAMAQQAGTPAPAPAPKVIAEIAAGTVMSNVKGAPFSADIVNESVQTLADGNRIVRKWQGKIYRNTEGSTRREGGSTPGAFGTVFSTDPSVTIFDQTGGFRYLLNTEGRTARVMTLPMATVRPLIAPGKVMKVEGQDGVIYLDKGGVDEAKRLTELKAAQTQLEAAKVEANAALVARATVAVPAMPAMPVMPGVSSKYETRKEDLGTQNIEGVDAEGTRTTTIIPADAIGNERPIEIVYERWYSKELKTIVFSRHFDPRFGEQTYRLTNINRSEPDPSLFEVPSGSRILNETRPTSPRAPSSQNRTTERTVRVSTTAATGRP